MLASSRDRISWRDIQLFFNRKTGLEGFVQGKPGWFYKEIRCAILHQAETTGGWRLRRTGKLLDEDERIINARQFIKLLQAAVADYAKRLENEPDLWVNFKTKMDATCKNCEISAQDAIRQVAHQDVCCPPPAGNTNDLRIKSCGYSAPAICQRLT